MNRRGENLLAQIIISVCVILGFLIVLSLLLCGFVKSFAPGLESAIIVLLGALTTKFGTVVDYWLGSSKSSQDKDVASMSFHSSTTKASKE